MVFGVGKAVYKNFKYPHHEHEQYEIIVYIKGFGEVFVDGKVHKVKEGNVLIVPPYIKHGSASGEGLESIYITGSFSKFFNFSTPVIIEDESDKEGVTLANFIWYHIITFTIEKKTHFISKFRRIFWSGKDFFQFLF